MILDRKNKGEALDLLVKFLHAGIDFKLQDSVRNRKITPRIAKSLLKELPSKGEPVDALLEYFEKNILPYCTNFSSRKFLGFPDAGNSVAALGGSILSDFLQQNLINQSFCAPSATFVEIAVLQWLREAVGYKRSNVKDIWSVGGVITPGGTVSNTIGIMLARENKGPGTLEKGVSDPANYKVIVPKGIGHYSVKSAQMWVGCGNNLVEVPTKAFRYDLAELAKVIRSEKGKVMALVAYAGDSRTMTVDNLDAIAALTRRIDPRIWLHADACHGFSLSFSTKLRSKLKGIAKFDSVSVDPHKVMLVPYTISALLVKDPKKMKMVTSISDLIMQEQYAFGQITPFLGSKQWSSLRLWFMMRNFGKEGLDELITQRHKLACYLAEKLSRDKDFAVLNAVEINSVAFFYVGDGDIRDPDDINRINKGIHANLLDKGIYHLHQFSIPDDGLFERGKIVYPLRFMCGNPNVTKFDIDTMIEHIRVIGKDIMRKNNR